MNNQLITPDTNIHGVLKERLRQAGIRAINHLRMHGDNACDLWFWQGPNGKCFITQAWKDGTYDLYYPTAEQDTFRCAIDAITYAGGTQ